MQRIGQPFAKDIASVTLGAFDGNNESRWHWITDVLSLCRFTSFLGAEVIFLQVPALPGCIFEAFPQLFPVRLNAGIEDSIRGA